LDFSVDAGEIFGLLGVNGCGKSTTIRLILNLVCRDSGNIYIEGQELTGRTINLKKKLGALIERPDFYLHLTAYKNLEILLRYSGLAPDKAKILEVLEIVGLQKFTYERVGIFSQGMRQRLGIAQAIVHEPELIILDEPFNGLDPQGMVEIRGLVLRLKHEFGKTILLSSHLLREIEMISDRMLIMRDGRAVAEGKVADLLNSFNSGVRLRVSDATQALKILHNALIETAEIRNEREITCQVGEDQIPQICRLLLDNQIDISAIIPERNLEDYFMSMV
jgi:ABC-2 type transport system ATP-binding protein